MAEEENNDEIIPQPKPFPPAMIEDVESETVAHQVRDYLWGKGPIGYQNVSAHLKRELVVRFVGFEMPDLPPQYFWRVRILADLYNLKEHLEAIQSYLKKQESVPEDLDRSIANSIILEEIGSDSQKRFAVQYYEYLVGHRLAKEKLAELVKLLAVLGPKVRPESLQTRMEREIQSLAGRENSDPEAGVEKRAIEELLDNEFFFIDEANQSRHRISEIADANARLLELIKAYLGLTDDASTDYFNLWVQQQIRRTAEATGNERVISAFRYMVKIVGEMNIEDEEFCKIRCYNAIEYFLGKLNPDEEEFMKKNRHLQIDPLRFMPVPLHIHEIEEEEEEEPDEEEETENENEE